MYKKLDFLYMIELRSWHTHQITPLERLNPARFETPTILKELASRRHKLAELKGTAASIPNQSIFINTLGLQEAKESSEIENIVTTHDELFKDDVLPDAFANSAAKEVLRHRQALWVGFELVRACASLRTLSTASRLNVG